MKFKDTDVSLHRSVDNSDPGFAVKGHKLRWISGGVEARRAGRMWQPLKASMLPEKIVGKMRESNPTWFTQGDTIRKKDLTLSFAPLALVEERRRTLKENQNANEAVFRGKVDVGMGAFTEADNRVIAERGEPSEQFS